MASADDFLKAGDLAGARAFLVEQARNAPADQEVRIYLFQLLAVLGEWDKAETHLRALAALSAEAQMLATVYSALISSERQRAAAWAGTGPFQVMVSTSPWIQTLASSLEAAARGNLGQAGTLRDEALDQAGDVIGEIDGRAFEWVADTDPWLGPCFEAVINGQWGLVPFEAVDQIKTKGPSELRDVVWLPAEIRLRSGQVGSGFLPGRYPGSEASADGLVRLARKTDWIDTPAGERPVGQRLWFLSSGDEIPLLEFRALTTA